MQRAVRRFEVTSCTGGVEVGIGRLGGLDSPSEEGPEPERPADSLMGRRSPTSGSGAEAPVSAGT